MAPRKNHVLVGQVQGFLGSGVARGSSSVLARLSFALLEERLGFPTVSLDVVSQRSRRQHRMCLPDISFRPFLHLPPPADMFWPRPQLKLL